MNTCHTSFSYIYDEHTTSKQSSRTSDQFIIMTSIGRERETERERQRERRRQRERDGDRETETET